MKCTICGNDLSPGDQFCNNCGTRISQTTEKPEGIFYPYSSGGVFPGNNAAGSTTPPNMGYDPNFTNAVFTPNRKPASPGTTIMRLIVIILIAVIVGGIFVYRSIADKTFDMGNFTITLPVTMEPNQSRNRYSLGLSSVNGKTELYSNKKMEFDYLELDLSSDEYKSVANIITEDMYINLLDEQMESGYEGINGYKKISLKGNTLKFTYSGNFGFKNYGMIQCRKHGKTIYMLIFICDDSDREQYSGKFDKYASSLSFKK
ncbi:MAG: zinc ribbon domain-containing protein [Ruminococcus sp.]|nr:zinc ribbon domain-containing protein [Ruminococcus sp.]